MSKYVVRKVYVVNSIVGDMPIAGFLDMDSAIFCMQTLNKKRALPLYKVTSKNHLTPKELVEM